MQQNQREMEAVVVGLTTKSDKIRALNRAGFTRSHIADFLAIRYQHVRNVLKDEERRVGAQASSQNEMADAAKSFEPAPATAQRVIVGKGGEVRIPQVMLDAAGVKEGDALLVRFDDEEIRLYTPAAITRRIQARYRALIPAGVSLVDELIAERRQEAERERNGE